MRRSASVLEGGTAGRGMCAGTPGGVPGRVGPGVVISGGRGGAVEGAGGGVVRGSPVVTDPGGCDVDERPGVPAGALEGVTVGMGAVGGPLGR